MTQASIRTPLSTTIILNGKQFIIDNTHVNYHEIEAALDQSDWKRVENLLNIEKQIQKQSFGAFTITNGAVFYNGEILHSVIVDRILNFMKAGQNFTPLIRFLQNLLLNPSKNSVDELYSFLEHKNLPITDDGCFLAYKKVRSDFLDVYSGKIDNSVGQKPSVPRRTVVDDKRKHCAQGLHVGSLQYVRLYSPENSTIVICKINPKNVVSVPEDHQCQKVRVCEYEVIGLYEGDLPDVIEYPEYSDTEEDFYNDETFEDEEDLFEDDNTCDWCGEESYNLTTTAEEDSLCDLCFQDHEQARIAEEEENLKTIEWQRIK